MQNLLPIKGEFTTVIRNETCVRETKFIVVAGEIKSTLIELGMLQIKANGSFTYLNHLKIPDKEKRCIVKNRTEEK